MSRTVVSVVIPTWNGAHLLAPCLEALGRQSMWPDFETVVVDNGSTDATHRVLAAHPWATVIRLPTNRGFAGAVNCGIRASTGDIVVLLNNDTEPEEDWLAQLVGGLERADGAGMATSKVLVHGRSGVLHTTGDVVDVAGWPRNRGVWETDRGQWDAEVDVFGANAAAGAYRRALFDDVGLLEEAFGSYMEDVDLAWRARLRGWRCIFVPEAIVYHHVSATGGGAAASYLVARNRCWLIARNYPTRLLIRSLPQVIGAQAAEALRALVAYRGAAARATLRGLAVGWLTWPRMLPARWRIQRSRSLPLPELERMLRGARWTRYHGRGAVSRGEEEE